ncbi:uncharacterized protein METZ01_LOCUS471609 [marine metagenome]|uniref:Uncharacterized protein n=1 Tax=marine metagenome TaxID=408172 RepID=A0A383BH88_9ZZZZ
MFIFQIHERIQEPDPASLNCEVNVTNLTTMSLIPFEASTRTKPGTSVDKSLSHNYQPFRPLVSA